jgi:DNA-binding protein H-NS
MTDDLVNRLRYDAKTWSDEICDEAADRIEQLEAALREARADIIDRNHARWSEYEGTDEEAVAFIDAALAGEKKDD